MIAYLVKPFQRIELIPAIDQAMGRCEQEWAIDAEVREAAAARRVIAAGHARRGEDRDPGAWWTGPRP